MIQGEIYVLRWQLQLLYAGKYNRTYDFLCWFSRERQLRKNFLVKLQAVCYQLQFYQRWASFAGFFFKCLTKSVDQWFLDGYFYLLLSLKLFSRKKSVLLKLPHLITPLPRLDESKEIYFAASWWALIIKVRCNVVPLYCSLILRSSQGFILSNGAIIRLQVD